MLICSVRGCGQPLVRDAKRLVCSRGHSFDIARSGYVNLLQPQERRSKHPGDTRTAIEARRRLYDRGVAQPLLRAIADFVRPQAADVVLEAGCGEGFYLGSLEREFGLEAHGVDIAVSAIEAAARHYPPDRKGQSNSAEDGERSSATDRPRFEWIVANADRFIPYSDGSFSLVLSITGRMNAPEFHRILRADGRLLVAISAPDDLIELRGSGRDRAPRTIEEFSKHFKLIDQRRASTQADLDEESVRDVLHSIYRPLRSQPVEAMRVTFSLDLLLLAPL